MILNSGFVIWLAFWAGVVTAVATFCLFLVILALRFLQNRRVAHREALSTAWRPRLSRALVAPPEDDVPAVRPENARHILSLWVYYHEFLEGECKENLNQLGRMAEIDLQARRLLRSEKVRERLIAIAVLGHLRDRDARRLLEPIARSESPYLSLAAAHALLRINPWQALPVVLPLIASRADWSPAKVMAMLREVGPEIVSKPLAEAALDAAPAYQPLLIIYLDTAYPEIALATIRRILMATEDRQVVITCLYQVGRTAHPDGLRILRRCLQHPDWLVQLHAVAGLGRMGERQDAPVLVKMLQHEQYWIRLRAAQALTKLPGVSVADLRMVRDRVKDPYARDMLDEVLEEQERAA